MDLQGTDSLLAGHHQIENFEPDEQRDVRILKDGRRDGREPITVLRAQAALPVPFLEIQLVRLWIATTRALNHAIRPALVSQVSIAGIFVWEHSVEVGQGHLADEFRFVLALFFPHERNIAETYSCVK